MRADQGSGGHGGGARLGFERDRWLRAMAASGPKPARIFFEAQLGYQAWLPGFLGAVRSRSSQGVTLVREHLPTVRVVTADGRVTRRRHLALSVEAQSRMARRLTAASLVVGVLGVAASANLPTNGGVIVEQRAAVGHAQTEALSAAPTAAAPVVAPAAPAAPPPPAPAGTPVAPPAERTIPAQRGALPVGKGMWIWLEDQAEGGNAEAIVARAKAVGLTHLYVRTGTLAGGFYAGPFLDRLLPLAHAASIRVYAWDFPYLKNVDNDVERAVKAITYLTPGGHRVDGYAADIELKNMGVNITPATGKHFGVALRRAVGANYPLIACVPRPSPALTHYPMADVVAAFDAIAPMVYWMNRDPETDMAGALRDLAAYGKPIVPVGQAYDGRAEGGPPGVPPRDQLIRFMQTGDRLGAVGVSWWSWQHASQEAWDAVSDAAEFRLPTGDGTTFSPGQVRAYQTLLTSLGFPTPIDGVWGAPATAAVSDYQRAARLPITGIIDEATLAVLLTPFAPPIQPQP